MSDSPDTSSSPGSCSSQPLFTRLADILSHYGQTTPQQIAILAVDGTSLTYGALWTRTTEIAGELRRFGVAAGDRVAVVLPGGADASVATVAVASAAVCVPLHAGFSTGELRRALQELDVSALLTSRDLESAGRSAAYSLGLPVIELSPGEEGQIGAFSLDCPAPGPPAVEEWPGAQDDAFVLLTSGSTAQPKLVPLTQCGICHSAYHAGVALSLESRDRLINVQPLAHAHGLISGLLTALAAGSSVVCAPAFEATAFLGWLSRFGATWYTAVPPIHRALIAAARRRSRGVQSSLRLIRSASSSLPIDVLTELESLFGVPVIETYGMTEAASQIAANPLARCKGGSVGKPAGADIAVIDSEGRTLAAGERGQVVLRGPAITRGYLKNDSATTSAFRDGWFRTGDLGYLDSDGYLFLLGRMNKADIINRGGQKVSPAEVERTLLSHPGVAVAVVFPVPHARLGEDVAAAVVPRAGHKVDARKLRRFVSERMARFKVPGLIRLVAAIPAATDGKLVRSELAAKFSMTTPRSHVHRNDQLTPPRSQAEWQLERIWAELLGLNEVSIHEDIFALGADSLTIAQALARLRSRFAIELSFRDIFDAPTIASLATLIEASKDTSITADIRLDAVPDSGGPLSLQQQRIHLLGSIDPIPHKYHVVSTAVLSGPLDIDALEAGLAAICERHETLRSIFPDHLGESIQVVTAVRPHIELDLEPPRGADTTVGAQFQKLLQQPFDIEGAPPTRLQLQRLGDNEHLLLIKQHHLITDGWSHRLFFEELEELYNARVNGRPASLPEISFHYRHYVEWQKAWLQTPAARAQLDYWHGRLDGLTELPLRTDRPRPERWTGSGARLPLKLPRSLSGKLRSLSRDGEVTLFMTLLAAFQCLLCRYTQHHDIAVGSLVANRNRLDVEPLIGMFVNAVVLRTDLSGDPSFREVLRRVRDVTLDAYRNQALPIEEILRTLRLPRSLDRNPLFRVMFILQKAAKPLSLHGLSARTVEHDPGIARSDLVLELIDDNGPLNGWLEYSSDLFEPDTIKRMVAHFRTLLEAIVADPDQPISRLQMLPATEREKVVAGWNRTPNVLPPSGDFLACFARHARRTPAAPAVSCAQSGLSYRELANRASAIASRLSRERIGNDGLVVLFAERGVEFLAALIAIQQAGGAFLPLDPDTPQARLAQIIQHSEARLVIAAKRSLATLEAALSGLPRKQRPRVLVLEELATAKPPGSMPPVRRKPSSLACVIYTSGSTGAPKGAMIEQKGMVNHLRSKIADLELSASDIVAQTAPQSFVIAIWQFLAPLMVGARVHIIAGEEVRDPALLMQSMLREGVTVLEIVPSLLRAILQPQPSPVALSAFGRLRSLVSTGERLAPDLCEDWFRHVPEVPLINAYGATETSDDVATCRLTSPPSGALTVPIGRAIANVKLYVLDQHMQPVPTGIAGELYAGGAAIGRGYLNDSEQTRRSFLRDPFSKSRSARLYRTGDLARWRADGTLECFGRVDHQVKILGCRLEVEEIEHVLMQHEAIRSAVVVARDSGRGETRLTAYLVGATRKPPSLDEIGDFVRTRLPAHAIPAGYVVLDELPLTAHGKLDRIALAKLDSRPSAADSDFVPPRNSAERHLADIWTDLLELDKVSVRSNFFHLGGHSLLAGRVMARVANVFGVSLPIRTVFEASTIEALALRIEEAHVPAGLRPRSPDTHMDYVPSMSILQDRVVRIERELPDLPQFNLPYVFRLQGPLNVAALERGLTELVRRHEALRTCFGWAGEGPVPSVVAASEAISPLAIEDISIAAPAGDKRASALLLKKAELRVEQEAWTPFDLARAPLFRVRLLRLGPDDHVLALIVHHVIVDGWSMGILFEELAEFYSAFAAVRDVRLPAPGLAFSYFAAWQRRWCASGTAARHLAYWKDCLRNASPVFAADLGDAGALLSSRTAHETFHLPEELIAALAALSHSEGATPFMALLAGFKAMLLVHTGRGDICVGTTMANRTEQWAERVVGPVENTTVIRTRVETGLPFREILRRTRHSVLEAYARQDFPFEALVAIPPDEGQPDLASLVQVFFVLQNAIPKPFVLPGIAADDFGDTILQAEPVLPVDGGRLTITLKETPTGMAGSCVYKTDLFKAKTVRSWLADYATILTQAAAEPDKPLDLPADRGRDDRRTSAEPRARTAGRPARSSRHKTFVG